MLRSSFLLALLCCTLTAAAQFPFGKYPAVTYRQHKDWTMDTSPFAGSGCLTFYTTIPQFFGQESITIRLSTCDSPAASWIRIQKGKHEIQRIKEDMSFHSGNLDEPIRVADFNGDGRSDIKLIVPYHGCGLAAMNVRVIYLIQQPGGRFLKIAYMDKMDGNRPERDMDGDGRYELITMDLRPYRSHNYWTFNIFSIGSRGLTNISRRFDYPLMVQYLNRDNFTPAPLDSTIRKKMLVMHPEEYDARR